MTKPTRHTNYYIRGIRDTSTPRATCPICHADCTTDQRTPILEFTCPRGHVFMQTLKVALAHARWIARYHAGQESNL